MNPVRAAFDPTPESVQFIDHRQVRWDDVRLTSYWLYKRFHYAYPGPIRELRQKLMVLPPVQYGDQRLKDYAVRVLGHDSSQRIVTDQFGNRAMLFYIPEVTMDVTFEVVLSVERVGYPETLPQISPEQMATFAAATSLTEWTPAMRETAQELAAQHADPLALAGAINTWVYQHMRYGWGFTTVQTSAIEALKIGHGLCQDYAHVMLALCRSIGMPARYVSGHLLGEGGSHAWVEVLLPKGDGFVAVPFDPTNHRRGNLSYITIAVGRDYQDVTPTSGSYVAPYQGRLTASKRAGLTWVEYQQQAC